MCGAKRCPKQHPPSLQIDSATKNQIHPIETDKARTAKDYSCNRPNSSWPTVEADASTSTVTPEKLLIYHGGTGRGVFLGMLRGATIFVCGVSTLIIAPAFFADEFPAYLAPLIVIGGALPLAFVAYTTAPFVNHIYLHLPAFARKSRETALDYARNLPSTAMVSIRTMKITLIPRVTEVHVSNLVPDKALLRPVSFRNRDPVSVPWWRGGTLKQFYAMEKSRDTRSTSKFYPELWEHVHKQIYSQRPGPQQ
ncbi:hypothetical protein BGW36DRAFT_361690 [Talaromyces proteolyticus]|uniref:Uncharacterized protein n=1 Tax=Talaromyces proteolyticus TaxID=1131652 RepID=A0AAD4KPL6_9EURO|nr:uncharacterized protein BGW36DRAFT_361690 [Talaromyces proteolyticus]KAH8693858.1 hypothetical protein BGW36DRAFT_361690 [Talaromyces proteolyticus]